MEPIPVFFENVNRTALVIKPNKPYFDWLNSIENLPDDPEIYSDTISIYYLTSRIWIKCRSGLRKTSTLFFATK